MATMSIVVTGKTKKWCFQFEGDEQHISDWMADGLNVVVIANTVPIWLPRFIPVRLWCFAQDVFNFRNPFK